MEQVVAVKQPSPFNFFYKVLKWVKGAFILALLNPKLKSGRLPKVTDGHLRE
jgi:hypothetical protein